MGIPGDGAPLLQGTTLGCLWCHQPLPPPILGQPQLFSAQCRPLQTSWGPHYTDNAHFGLAGGSLWVTMPSVKKSFTWRLRWAELSFCECVCVLNSSSGQRTGRKAKNFRLTSAWGIIMGLRLNGIDLIKLSFPICCSRELQVGLESPTIDTTLWGNDLWGAAKQR